MIKTEALSKHFQSDGREIRAVDDLDLEVREGEVFGFLGPNGANKTTTVRLLAGPTDRPRPCVGQWPAGGRGG